MATHDRLHLTNQQATPERVMKAVVGHVQDTGYVLMSIY